LANLDRIAVNNARDSSDLRPRVFPKGTGAPNPKGLDFYDRLLDELLKNGIEPFATLYHWDLPQSLQDTVGGWQSSETSKAFANYAGYVADRLTDRVKNIFAINESGRFVNFGYEWGIDAPGLKLPPAEVNQIHHNVALAHGLAVQAIRARGRTGTKVGPAENIAACVPAIDTPANIEAAGIATREFNAGFLNVILEGKYTDRFLKYTGKDAPKFTADELRTISTMAGLSACPAAPAMMPRFSPQSCLWACCLSLRSEASAIIGTKTPAMPTSSGVRRSLSKLAGACWQDRLLPQAID
jgi:beta-glucosidase/6-phospho-beta-glucosidase/beta-galactosidase